VSINAYYETEFLQATFFVHLRDSIFGELTLQASRELVRKAFGKNYRSSEICIVLSTESTESMKLENKLLPDVVAC